MKKRMILGSLCILLAAVVLLGFLQALLVPKYMTVSREGALTAEYYHETTFDHDVLFIGDCEVYECFTPPTLWQEYGITSYIRGTPQQLAWQSYYLLEDALRYETPRVVVFNVFSLKYGKPQNEAYNRMTLDGMKWSRSKVDAILASMTEEESFASYLFPLLRFHSRWKELGREDLQYLLSRDLLSHNGYLMQTAVKPPLEGEVPIDPLADYTLPKTSMDYLDRMRTLCTEHEIQLILIKAPTNNWRFHWYDEWDEQIQVYADEFDLTYYNFIPLCDEIGIDWSTDTYDGGAHLNVFGAEKLTSYFGAILKEAHGLADRSHEQSTAEIWSEKLDRYLTERNSTPH